MGRSLLFQLCFWLYTIPMNIAWLPSLLLPRIVIRKGLEYWCLATLWALRTCAGITFEVRGRERLPGGPYLLASKHQSMWETIAINVILKDPAVIVKKELSYVPFWGWFAHRMGSIWVDRDAGASALKSMVTEAKDRLAHGRAVVIFPEGTRKVPGAEPDYKPGIAALYSQLGVPCVPAALNSGLFWPRSGPWRKPGHIVFEFLEPIPPGLKRQAFMAELQSRIETRTAELLAAS
ncbi:MAG TPA: 1-acyl-sn-glycerol-3-phosphate acyltransferase [Alphaproteobacteria bacterium]|nr:1-acyl-sn-glycerol-3-phosphate acyltransferase [Alphaproteobacteria bacterium]HAJ48482.1 1-acyl-sn-glycerol-3-phosphate acyltransferase [Alphaproteobacteria bacterium]